MFVGYKLLKNGKKSGEDSSAIFTIIKQYKTDGRDVSPIYVLDKNGKQVIEDWGFNGWGSKFKNKKALHLYKHKCSAFLFLVLATRAK